MILRILAVGDVVGAPGLTFLTERLRAFQEQEHIDFTVVNGENANVVGVTPKQADAIFAAGADVITLGNHTWTRYELQPYLEQKKRILRPANFAPQCPGRGWGEYSVRGGPICVINLMGRFTLDANTDNPFLVADDILDQTQAKIVLVDMHAEATSEKRAMGFYLDGRVTAVWGTHTHVQTSDAEVLPEGTGYLTDLGMTGPANAVLGIAPEQSIGKFLGDPPRRYEAAMGAAKLEGAIFEVDSDTGRCRDVQLVRLRCACASCTRRICISTRRLRRSRSRRRRSAAGSSAACCALCRSWRRRTGRRSSCSRATCSTARAPIPRRPRRSPRRLPAALRRCFSRPATTTITARAHRMRA